MGLSLRIHHRPCHNKFLERGVIDQALGEIDEVSEILVPHTVQHQAHRSRGGHGEIEGLIVAFNDPILLSKRTDAEFLEGVAQIVGRHFLALHARLPSFVGIAGQYAQMPLQVRFGDGGRIAQLNTVLLGHCPIDHEQDEQCRRGPHDRSWFRVYKRSSPHAVDDVHPRTKRPGRHRGSGPPHHHQ